MSTFTFPKWIVFASAVTMVGCQSVPRISSFDIFKALPRFNGPKLESIQGVVNSVGSVEVTGRRYKLVPDEAMPRSLMTDELTARVSAMLTARGVVLVDNPDDAEALILYRAGVGLPSTTVSTTMRPNIGVVGYRTQSAIAVGNGYAAAAQQSTPQFGITGYHPVQSTSTHYMRHLVIGAYRFADGAPEWVVVTTSSGSSPDIRAVLPALLFASKPWIGVSSGKMVPFDIPHQ